MKKVIAIMLAVVLVVGGLGSFAYANSDPGNEVHADFSISYTYRTAADSVDSITTTQPMHIHSHLHNRDDDTNKVVDDPILDLSTTQTVTDVKCSEYLVTPPAGIDYRWEFPDIGEDEGQGTAAGLDQMVEFTTGFEVKRSVNPVSVPSTGGTQTLTLSVTPREAMEKLEIHGNTKVGELDIATISLVSGPNIGIGPDGRSFHIHIEEPAIGTTYQWQITIVIGSLPSGYPAVDFEYMPFISVRNVHFIDSGVLSMGSSLSGDSYALDGTTVLGTWTWQATGDYCWGWNENVSKEVNLEGYAEIPGNRVNAGFETAYIYRTEGDFVGNITTTQPAGIHSYLHNRGDATGEDVVGLSKWGGPILDLVAGESVTVTDVKSDYLVSTDPYRWEFPPIKQDESFAGYAQTDQMVQFTTGFDVSRSVNKTIFPPTGGTQELTLSVTPEEAMDRLEVHGKTHVGEPDIATITSVSGEGIGYDEHGFHIYIEEPVVDHTYVWTITIDIGPLPPEYPAVELEYMPFISVGNVDFIDSGSSSGSSLSGKTWSLDGGTVLGTWEWEASGDYCWWWSEEVSKEVQLEGYAEIQCNRVHASFETSYTYRTAGDEVGNITTTQPTEIHSHLHNQRDATGELVYDPILDLSTDETVTYVKEEYLKPSSEYTWEFPNIGEDQGFDGGANIAGTVEFWTGFSVTRSVDQARFPPEGGTQILTLNVTPAEAMEKLEIHGKTRVDELDIATITSVSGPNIDFEPGGYSFHIGIDKPIVDQPYQWTITIDIGSLPPEYLALEYMPRIHVRNVHFIASGSDLGSSLSRDSYSLDGVTVLGTWTWQTSGDYCWGWNENVSKGVELEGYAINAFVEPPTQDAINDAIDNGLAWLRSQQKPDGSWYWAQPGEEEQPSVGMSGLAVWSLLHAFVPQTDDQVQAGIEFILSQQNTNQSDTKNYGAISSHGPQVYETAIAILALRATNNPVYLDEMTLAADYLARSQNDEGVVYPHFPGGIGPEDPAYGGWSYGYGQDDNRIHIGPDEWIEVPWYVRADLSCTQFAMIGLKAAQEAGVQLTYDTWSEVWRKAEIYVTRCQNPDGGFTYQPQGMPGGGGGSYGSMTAGGVWCLALTGVLVDDSRVEDGLAWLDCNPFYDRNPPGGRHNHYYFLWSAAKAFTHYGRPPVLEEGTWYYDYAGYLLANQDASGQWVNPQYLVDMDDRESHLNRTEYALLILEKAVLPPPPGIDFIEVDLMKILFDRSPNRDKMEIKAHFQLAEGASYNLDEDTVTVTIGGVVITIPPGSFVGSAGKYEFKSDGEPKVGMTLNFNNGEWSLKVGHIDASAIDSSDGIPVVDVNVTLMIGYMLAGENVPTWCNDLVYP